MVGFSLLVIPKFKLLSEKMSSRQSVVAGKLGSSSSSTNLAAMNKNNRKKNKNNKKATKTSTSSSDPGEEEEEEEEDDADDADDDEREKELAGYIQTLKGQDFGRAIWQPCLLPSLPPLPHHRAHHDV